MKEFNLETTPLPKLSPGEAVAKILRFAEKLKELGFTPAERFFNLETLQNPIAMAGFPAIEGEGNSIRFSYDRGVLTLWFTNLFADPENEMRKKVQETWNTLS